MINDRDKILIQKYLQGDEKSLEALAGLHGPFSSRVFSAIII